MKKIIVFIFAVFFVFSFTDYAFAQRVNWGIGINSEGGVFIGINSGNYGQRHAHGNRHCGYYYRGYTSYYAPAYYPPACYVPRAQIYVQQPTVIYEQQQAQYPEYVKNENSNEPAELWRGTNFPNGAIFPFGVYFFKKIVTSRGEEKQIREFLPPGTSFAPGTIY
jgi:hypothetical protein